MSYTQLQEIIYDLLDSETDINWHFRYQNFVPSRENAYGTIYFPFIPARVYTLDQQVYADNNIEYYGPRDFTLSLNIYGTGAMNIMNSIEESTDTIYFRDKLRTFARQRNLDVVWISNETIIDFTELLDNKYEERAEMDCNLRVGLNKTDPALYIEPTDVTLQSNIST